MDIFGFSRNVQKLQTSTKSCKRGVKNNEISRMQRLMHIMVTKLQNANCKNLKISKRGWTFFGPPWTFLSEHA
jgi:hypothetical protein